MVASGPISRARARARPPPAARYPSTDAIGRSGSIAMATTMAGPREPRLRGVCCVTSPGGGSNAREAAMRRIATWMAWWVFSFAAWLLLVDTLARAEVIAGAIVAVVATIAAEAVRRARLIEPWPFGLLPEHL